jgi:glycosyltransferase involved in cell wall biosynthesis
MPVSPPQPAANSDGVSIVIPAYNYAHYLPLAVDSALAQTHSPVEVMVIDDGSSDNTPEVMGAYGDRVVYIRQENRGLSGTRNRGLQEAKYDRLVFLDADDMLAPTMVERCLATMRSVGDDCVLTACLSRHVDENGTPLRKTHPCGDGVTELDARSFAFKNRFQPSAALVCREPLLAAGGFDESLTSSEDRDAWLRIAAFGKVVLLPEPLLDYRIHTASMSHNASRMCRNMLRVLGKARAAGTVPRWSPFWLRAYAFLWFQVAWMHFEGQDRAKAVGCLLFSIALCPWVKRDGNIGEPVFFRLRALRRFLLSRPEPPKVLTEPTP